MKAGDFQGESFESAKSAFLRRLEFFKNKQFSEAEIEFRKSLSLLPNRESTLNNLSATLFQLGRYSESKIIAENVLSIADSNHEAWVNLGNAQQKLDEKLQALKSYKKAVCLEPQYAEAWYNRGKVFHDIREYAQALASYDKALEIRTDLAEAWANRGSVLLDVGRIADAVDSYREALKINQEFLDTHSNLLFALNYLENSDPLNSVHESKKYGLKVSKSAHPKFNNWKVADKVDKLRIGIVSGDLRNHPVGYFAEGLLARLNQACFEIIVFPTTLAVDSLTNRLTAQVKQWYPIARMSDRAAAELIYGLQVNVLIDLSGHTSNNRLGVFSYRPAPLQITWLGLPMTTGLPEMDFILGDPNALPQKFENQFTEAVWRLPETYLCLTIPVIEESSKQVPATKNGFITFGSFNNLSKVNDEVLRVWSTILKAVPKSKIMLMAKQFSDKTIRSEICCRFQRHGVDPDRLVLKSLFEAREDHIAAYGDIDIALDTFPYPGVTTTVEAVWMGVPIITLKGNSFLSNTGVSIAKNVGLSDWVALDLDDYINKAVRLASNIEMMARIKADLIKNSRNSPLFDISRFARHFEQAIVQMWRQCPRRGSGISA